MSKVLISNYTFDASAKTIALNDYGTIILENVLLVTNVTDNIIIYSFDGIGEGGAVATNVLTLDFDTTAMDDTDKLQIWYWDDAASESISGTVTANAGTNLNTSLLALEGGGNLAAILAKIISAPATEAKQDTLNAKDFATQTTLAAVLAKIISAPATETTVAAILAKIIAAPATEAKQDTLIAKDFATQTTLAAVLAKIIAAPATEATLATLALEATQLLIKAKTDNIDVALSTRLKPADTLTAVTTVGTITNPVALSALPAGTNNIGDVDVLSLPALPTGTNNIGDVDVLTLPTLPAGTNNIGDVDVLTLPALPAGTNAIGKLAANDGVDIGDVTINNTVEIPVKLIPQTSGGLTTYHLVSAATTNATVVKASAGQLFGWYIYNSNAAARKVAFHNASSTPTAGASIFFTIVIPPTSGANVFSDIGIAFSTGISITTVTGLADNDSAAVAANDLIINLFYK